MGFPIRKDLEWYWLHLCSARTGHGSGSRSIVPSKW